MASLRLCKKREILNYLIKIRVFPISWSLANSVRFYSPHKVRQDGGVDLWSYGTRAIQERRFRHPPRAR